MLFLSEFTLDDNLDNRLYIAKYFLSVVVLTVQMTILVREQGYHKRNKVRNHILKYTMVFESKSMYLDARI